MSKIKKGDEVTVCGELLYVEKRSKKKWYKPFSDNYWQCYNGYGEDVVVKETAMFKKEH